MTLLDFSRAKCCLVWSFCASTALCIIEWSGTGSIVHVAVQAISILQLWECCYGTWKDLSSVETLIDLGHKESTGSGKALNICIYLIWRPIERAFHPWELWWSWKMFRSWGRWEYKGRMIFDILASIDAPFNASIDATLARNFSMPR